MFNAIYCEQGHYVEPGDADSGDYARLEAGRKAWGNPTTPEYGHSNTRYCPECGSRTLRICPQCQFPILYDEKRPNYCRKCGKQFPWTETALRAAGEFTDELEDITDAEKTALKATFQPMTVDSPQTQLAANRFKRLIRKLGPPAGDMLTKIIINVASEAAKKGMGS